MKKVGQNNQIIDQEKKRVIMQKNTDNDYEDKKVENLEVIKDILKRIKE